MELDCSLFLAVPIYSVIKDIYVAFAISNLIFALIYIWVLFNLFKEEKVYIPLMISSLIFIPYSIGQLDYYNMTFFNGGQYVMKILLPLMLLSIYKFREFKKKYIPFYVVFLLFTFITGLSSGIYVIACGFAPVILYDVIVCLFEKKCDNRKNLIYNIWVTVITIVIYALALLAGKIMSVGALGDTMCLCKVSSLQENIEANFWGIFDIFGAVARDQIPVMSISGIMTMVKMLLVAIMILTGIVVAIREFKESREKKTPPTLSAAFILMFAWNLMVLFVCDTRYGLGCSCYRYQLIGVIPLICMCVFEWIKKTRIFNKKIESLALSVSVIVIVMLMGYSVLSFVRGGTNYSDLAYICNFANVNNVDRVYYLYASEPAEISRILDYKSDIKYLSVAEDGNTFVYDYYLDEDLIPADFTNSLLVISGIDDQSEMKFMNIQFEDVVEIGGYTIMKAK